MKTSFDWKNKCFLCGKDCLVDRKHPSREHMMHSLIQNQSSEVFLWERCAKISYESICDEKKNCKYCDRDEKYFFSLHFTTNIWIIFNCIQENAFCIWILILIYCDMQHIFLASTVALIGQGLCQMFPMALTQGKHRYHSYQSLI